MTAQTNNRYLPWGVLLIVVGFIFLVNQVFPGLGLNFFVQRVTEATLLGLAAGVVYLVYRQHSKQWWMLLLAYCMAVGSTTSLLRAFFPWSGHFLDILGMYAVAAPFIYVYYKDRSRWWALIPGGILAFGATAELLNTASNWMPFVLIAAGVAILAGGFVRKPSSGQNGHRDTPLVEMMPLGGPQADVSDDAPVHHMN